MKYCKKCGAESPDMGTYCIECGERLEQKTEGSKQISPINPSLMYQQPYPPFSADIRPPAPFIQPVREKYGHIIFHSSYNLLIIGALAFALSPLIGIGVNFLFMFVSSVESEVFSFLVSFVEPICFGIFIYGIYSISRSEPSSVNVQLRPVPIYLGLYVILSFLTGFLFGGFETTTMETIDQIRDMAVQGMIFVVIDVGFSAFLVIGALKFTNWFEDFVIMLGAPYNAPTARFKWFSFITLGYWGLLTASMMMLISAIDNFSISTVENAILLLNIATIVIFITIILQILSGYKIYSVLSNIRRGKYDGTYQAQIKKKYQF